MHFLLRSLLFISNNINELGCAYSHFKCFCTAFLFDFPHNGQPCTTVFHASADLLVNHFADRVERVVTQRGVGGEDSSLHLETLQFFTCDRAPVLNDLRDVSFSEPYLRTFSILGAHQSLCVSNHYAISHTYLPCHG